MNVSQVRAYLKAAAPNCVPVQLQLHGPAKVSAMADMDLRQVFYAAADGSSGVGSDHDASMVRHAVQC